jgi:hypothetical protein
LSHAPHLRAAAGSHARPLTMRVLPRANVMVKLSTCRQRMAATPG